MSWMSDSGLSPACSRARGSRNPVWRLREVALGERTARARLEVLLKPHGLSFASKFHGHH